MNNKCIYKITNLITGWIYIGQTNNFKRRKWNYSKCHCKTQRLLFKSIKRHGWSNHVMELIEDNIDTDIVDKVELQYIEKFNSCYYDNPEKGLNLEKDIKSRKDYAFSKSFYEAHNKGVLQYDLDGHFIKEWVSITAASKELGLQMTGISLCCKYKRKRTGCYTFRYKEFDDFDTELGEIILDKPYLNYGRKEKKDVKPRYTKIMSIDIVTGEEIIFPSIKDCGIHHKLKSFYICRIMNSVTTYKKRLLFSTQFILTDNQPSFK